MHRSRLSHRLRILFSSTAICLLASCGHFDSEWKKSLAGTSAKQPIEGAWTGTWKSEVTGHTGKLRCIVGPATNPEGDHVFRYHARWGRIFAASFVATHRVRPTGNGVRFSGAHEMPSWVGGTYQYDGTARDGTFSATYRSSKDRGLFELRRPK